MSSLRDGLGGEEIQASGLQAGGVSIGPYFTGSITSESIVAGTQLTTAGSLTATGNVIGANFVPAGSVVSTGNLETSAGVVVAGSVNATGKVITSASAQVAGSVVSTGVVIGQSMTLSSVGNAGSPTTWGMLGLAGSGAAGAGSNVWVTFGTAFGGPPAVTASELDTAGEWVFVPLGSITAGSFYAETQSASANFSWHAFGPGA